MREAMNGHHLVLGQITDVITGEVLVDTHDERLRQGIARYLVTVKGFAPETVRPRQPLTVSAGGRRAGITVDFLVELDGLAVMVIHYGPGSLVTRHRPALAISRLLRGYQIPWVVVSNGLDAEILEGISGRKVGSGLTAIPDHEALRQQNFAVALRPVTPERAVVEARILFAYEVDGRCPCDNSVCTAITH